VPTEVTWVHNDDESGEEMVDTFIVHVRRMSVGWLDRVLQPGTGAIDRSRTASLISEAILFGENGEEKISYADAYQLDFGLAAALLGAFSKVNRKGEGASDPKASTPPMSSGTS